MFKLQRTSDPDRFVDPDTNAIWTRHYVRDLRPQPLGCSVCLVTFDPRELCLVRDDHAAIIHTYASCSGIEP